MSAQDESAVKPSTHLIATFKSRLHDPSVVARFELGRQPDTLGSLVRSHWVLHASDSEYKIGNFDGNSRNDNETAADACKRDLDHRIESYAKFTKPNAIPKRNHIDLRIQQNKIFADERFRQYKKLYADWKDDKGPSIDKRRKQWDMMKSCIKDGLGACPDHEGLLDGQKQMNAVHSNQIGRDVEPPVVSHAQLPSTQKHAVKDAERTAPETQGIQLKAEGRAYAAIQDALLERNFLTEEAGTSYGDGKYTLLPEQDSRPNSEQLIDPEKSSDSSSNSESYRRRKKERRRKKDKYKKKRKSKHEKKKKHRRKSRKRSRSSSASKSGTRY